VKDLHQCFSDVITAITITAATTIGINIVIAIRAAAANTARTIIIVAAVVAITTYTTIATTSIYCYWYSYCCCYCLSCRLISFLFLIAAYFADSDSMYLCITVVLAIADDLSANLCFITASAADITTTVSITPLSSRFSSSTTHCHRPCHSHHRVDYPWNHRNLDIL